ncbi:type-2 ice-structuring protein-like [Poeciliopsis prolifica]|uniref:type-2 ice-structuring protein-like n=1 Tax=Poeciliopsis prolifica TaxID=188132 RepID=UPI00241447C2|nr:type-2 ice-structuring protein-like [Poeciliopsis prolifica]XP_054912189.1 type-2 ice-structuring protein-like [Poeciliopsis prolifica]
MRILPLPLLLCGLMLLSSVNEINGHRTYCPHGWRLIHGRCFKYVPRRMTWAKAERNCISMGGNLASVHSSDEYHGIQGLILQVTHEMREAWIGGTDAAEENHWHWSDGTLMTFTYWCPGEPNNHAYHQHCMQMNFSGEKCWDDYRCTVRLPSVCVLKK